MLLRAWAERALDHGDASMALNVAGRNGEFEDEGDKVNPSIARFAKNSSCVGGFP